MKCIGLWTTDAAPHQPTFDDVRKALADLSARVDRLNEKRMQTDAAARLTIQADSSDEQRRRLIALNETHAEFWRARG